MTSPERTFLSPNEALKCWRCSKISTFHRAADLPDHWPWLQLQHLMRTTQFTRIWAQDTCVLVLKSICWRVQQPWRWCHQSRLCCQCASSGLRGHWPMMLVGNYKTLEKAPSVWKGAFFFLSPVFSYMFTQRQNRVWGKKGKRIGSSYFSQWKKRAVGRKQDAFPLVYITGA